MNLIKVINQKLNLHKPLSSYIKGSLSYQWFTNIKYSMWERIIALNAARALGLNVAGVDLIRSSSGSKVLEVNSSPGIEGIEKATKKNIAGSIIKFIEENVRLVNISSKKY